MTRTRHPHEHLLAAATSVPVTLRPARLRGGQLYKVDARDPGMITVYLAHDITHAERREIADDLDEALRVVMRRRRRADLEPVAELVGDEGLDEELDEATGTDGDPDPGGHRADLSVVR